MSEIFWIGRGEFGGPGAELGDSVRKGGIQPGWLQMVHWIGKNPILPLAGSSASSLAWQPQPGLAAFLIHDTCRSLLMRELNLAVLVEESPGETINQVILASPIAIGKHNLLPRAHLTAWWAVPASALGKLGLWLEKSGYDPQAVRFVAGETELAGACLGGLPAAQLLSGQPDTTIGQLNRLVEAQLKSRAELGLLVSRSGGPTFLVTLVEL